MSVHEGHDAALAHHDEELQSDEPSTPMWLPLLGGVLLFAGIGAFLLMQPAGKSGQDLATEAAAAQAAAQPAEPAPAQAAQPQPNPQGGVVQAAAQPQPGQPTPAQRPAPSGGCGM